MLYKLFFSLIVLLCTSCATTYGPNLLTGGYSDEKIDDDTYIVSFHGNGYASEERVWYFWIYRCAEITKEKGYDYFKLTPIDKTSKYYNKNADKIAYEFTMLDPKKLFDDDPDSNLKKAYYYTITTYSSRARVDMYKHPGPSDIKFLLNAQTILDELDKYVKSDGNAELVGRKELLMRAAIEASIRRKQADKYSLQGMDL